MDEHEPIAELIQKYLDGSAAETELNALETRLVRDPQTAEALADAVRLEAGLTRLFRAEMKTTAVLSQIQAAEQRKPDERTAASLRFSRRSMWQAAASILLAVGTVALLYRFLRPDPQPAASLWNEVVAGDVLIDGTPGQLMHNGSSLQVLGDDPAVVHLTDGSQAEFDPGATALIHGREAGLRQWVELNEGSGTFHVEKGHGEFQVATQLGSVSALGTEFSVAVQPTSLIGGLPGQPSALLIVAVLSGVVQVEFGEKTYDLAAGERRVFGEEGKAPTAGEQRRIPASPPPGTRRANAANTVRGPISFVDRTKVTLGSRLRHTDFELAPNVCTTIDGKPAALDEFRSGMVVAVERKDGEGPVIRMSAEGPTIGGSFLSLDEESRSITILTVGGDSNSKRTYPVADNASIIFNGQPGKLSDLKSAGSVSLKLSVDFKAVIAVTRARRRSS